MISEFIDPDTLEIFAPYMKPQNYLVNTGGQKRYTKYQLQEMGEKIPILFKYFGPSIFCFDTLEMIEQYYFRFDKCFNFPNCKKDIGHH